MKKSELLRVVGGKATRGTLTILLAWWAFSLVASPAIFAYAFGGVGWAALTLIATLGVAVFIVKFAPYYIACLIANAVAEDVRASAKKLEDSEQYGGQE